MRGLFVHSEVDDAGLSPAAFRVLANLARRADKRRRCWPSVIGIAEVCRMSRPTAMRAIEELERAGWVKCDRRKGKRTTYCLGLGKPERSSTLTGKDALPVNAADRSKPFTGKKEAPHRSTVLTTPVKNFDPKGIHSGNPKRKSNARVRAGVCEEIYAAYPRHVGKLAAIRAIEKAIRGGADPAMLLERVKAFAVTSRSMETRFVPHPATWFNAGRWEDEGDGTDRSDGTDEAGRVAVESEAAEPPVVAGPDEAHLRWLEAQGRVRQAVVPGNPFAATETVAGSLST